MAATGDGGEPDQGAAEAPKTLAASARMERVVLCEASLHRGKLHVRAQPGKHLAAGTFQLEMTRHVLRSTQEDESLLGDFDDAQGPSDGFFDESEVEQAAPDTGSPVDAIDNML